MRDFLKDVHALHIKNLVSKMPKSGMLITITLTRAGNNPNPLKGKNKWRE
jgi:hypothetical protein